MKPIKCISIVSDIDISLIELLYDKKLLNKPDNYYNDLREIMVISVQFRESSSKYSKLLYVRVLNKFEMDNRQFFKRLYPEGLYQVFDKDSADITYGNINEIYKVQFIPLLTRKEFYINTRYLPNKATTLLYNDTIYSINRDRVLDFYIKNNPFHLEEVVYITNKYGEKSDLSKYIIKM